MGVMDWHIITFLKILFIYLTQRENTSRGKGWQREKGKQAPAEKGNQWNLDPGLHPRTLGSLPEPKADA